ncbi:MAG: T9SS type A sorting domain-containing protein [Cyclobacteriaceae bacterium]
MTLSRLVGCLVVILSLYIIPVSGQHTFNYSSDIKVIENDETLSLAFSGGLNSGQYNTIDLNLDGKDDLVVFDRSSNQLKAFLSNGEAYSYAPEFEYLFPENIQNWMLLVDYNCDGKKDLFTYTNLGIRVFKNTSVQSLTWELQADPIYTQGTSTLINLLVNSSDVPSIADLDGDGDLDILTYNFAIGAFIEFHRNISIENNGNCEVLDFIRESREYGDFEECTCNEFVFAGENCSDGGRVLHAGGKSILALDQDNDGDKELIIAQEECTDLALLENKGSASIPMFDSFSKFFPERNSPLSFNSFPAPYYEDVNFDGLKDIIVAPNLRSNSEGNVDNANSSLLYVNTGSNENPAFRFEKEDFLQDEMIDVGEFSYPAFVDVDGDSDEDLIIGNRGVNISGNYSAALVLYMKTPEGFVFSDDDFMSLSSLNFNYINPSFVDVNEDGKMDLFFMAVDQRGEAGLQYILNSSNDNSLNFQARGIQNLDFAISAFDDAEYVDMSQDGVLDLLVGKTNGKLEYYINSGSNESPSFNLESDTFLNLDFSSARGNLNIDVTDLGRDGKLDLVSTDRSGVMRLYNISSPIIGASSELLQLEGASENIETRLGRITHPTFGEVNGKTVVAIGNIEGGITLLESTVENGVGEDDISFDLFPNPSNDNRLVKIYTNDAGAQLEVFGVTGNRLFGPVELQPNEVLPLDLSTYQKGLYFARIRKGKKVKVKKFVLGHG